MKKARKLLILIFIIAMTLMTASVALASSDNTAAPDAAAQTQTQSDETQSGDSNTIGMKSIAVGIAIGLGAAGGAIGMGIVGGKSADGISRQPEAEGKIRTNLMLTLVFIEDCHHLCIAGSYLGNLCNLESRYKYEHSIEHRLAADLIASVQLCHIGRRALSAPL